jgi:hypothetical protein
MFSASVLNKVPQGDKIMAVKKTVVSAIYQNAEQAKRAVAEFLAAGFSKESVTISDPGTERGVSDSAATTGGVQLSVHCDTSEQITQAKDLLKQTGAKDISSIEETREIFVES